MVFNRWAIALAALLPFSAGAQTVSAPPSGPMAFSQAKVCQGEKCKPVLLAEGSIEADSPSRFDQALQSLIKNGVQVETVVLHSRGGDLGAGLRLGLMVRRLGLSTQVVEGGACASACAYTFLGGRTRTLSPNGYLGVHRFSAAGQDPGADSSQQVVNLLTNYIDSLGVSTDLVRVAAQASPGSMRQVTLEQARYLRVDNTRGTDEPWSIQTRFGHLDLVLENTSIRNDRRALINFRHVDSENAMAVFFQEPEVYSKPRTEYEVSKTPFATLCRIGTTEVCVEGKPQMGWRKEKEDGRYGSLFTFSKKDLETLSKGSEDDQILVVVGGKGLDYPLLAIPSTARGFRTAWQAISRSP